MYYHYLMSQWDAPYTAYQLVFNEKQWKVSLTVTKYIYSSKVYK